MALLLEDLRRTSTAFDQDIPIVLVTNVSDYVEETRQTIRYAMEKFPVMVPPYPQLWMEYTRHPITVGFHVARNDVLSASPQITRRFPTHDETSWFLMAGL